ncbi:MAG: AAA family ATPase, partial [Stenotrophomonas maltophilia]
MSIRVIAAELSVHKGRVERALKLVAPRQDPDKLGPRTDPANRIFVGRQQELAVLKAALEESLTGRGRLTMLMGEPGIGKTSTAQELASYAETLGTQVLWGRCYEEEGAPPCGISRISTAR